MLMDIGRKSLAAQGKANVTATRRPPRAPGCATRTPRRSASRSTRFGAITAGHPAQKRVVVGARLAERAGGGK